MTSPTLVCFGKVPSRGDFIRSAEQPVVTQTLDRWASQAVELMGHDPRWKQVYDAAPAVHFAFMGVHSPMVLAGHLRPSADASGRRFPLVTASAFEVADPLRFLATAPWALARLWPAFERSAVQLQRDSDVVATLARLDGQPLEPQPDPAVFDAVHDEFLDGNTLASLRDMLAPRSGLALRPGDAPLDVRRTILGLGLLLRPVPASGAHHLEKGVVLPLPSEPQRQIGVASLWVDLVHRFIAKGAFEIVLYLPRPASGTAESGAFLAIGFAGGAPAQLQAMLDGSATQSAFVDLREAEWVDDSVREDYALHKLSSYLEQPQLSLRQMVRTFRETFLGE